MKTLTYKIAEESRLWEDYHLRKGEKQLLWNYYYSTVPQFSILRTKIKNGAISPSSLNMYTCREEAIMKDILLRIARTKGDKKKLADWFDKARVVLHLHRTHNSPQAYYDTLAERALHQINVVDKYMGWSLTKLYSLVHPKFANSVSFHLFEGSNRWIKSPQMISLYMLMIRAPINYGSGPALGKIKSLSALEKYWNSTKSGDGIRMRAVMPHLKKLLDNYNLLFGKRSFVDLHTTVPNNGYYVSEGIQKLITGYSADSRLKKTWNKIK